MMTRKALKASAKARKNVATQGSYMAILREGEKAALLGQSLETNPYVPDSEDAAIWAEGYLDIMEEKRKQAFDQANVRYPLPVTGNGSDA